MVQADVDGTIWAKVPADDPEPTQTFTPRWGWLSEDSTQFLVDDTDYHTRIGNTRYGAKQGVKAADENVREGGHQKWLEHFASSRAAVLAKHDIALTRRSHSRKDSKLGVVGIAGCGRSIVNLFWLMTRNTRPEYRRIWQIGGSLGSVAVSACPDFGSQLDTVSAAFAKRHGLHVDERTTKSVRLPNGHLTGATGVVTLPFRFQNERKQYYRDFHVLQECTHEVILGSSFLKMTKTLTHFQHRIQEKLVSVSSRPKVCLAGGQKQRVMGFLNRGLVSAIPDTGSDVMLMSSGYAKERNLVVHDGHHDQTYLELADVSVIRTRGQVHSCLWSFRPDDTPIEVNFHVLDKLPFDVILSNEFLLVNDVFTEYPLSFYEDAYAVDEESNELSLVRELSFWDRLKDRILCRGRRSTKSGSSFYKQEQAIMALEERQKQIRRELQDRERTRSSSRHKARNNPVTTPTTDTIALTRSRSS